MFATLSGTIPADPDYSPRVQKLHAMRAVLKGTIYDGLTHEFHDEQTGTGEYVPLRKRRPCVRYNLCRLVVQDSISLLFGEGRFPIVESNHDETRQTLADIATESKLNQVMLDAAMRGSVGSVVVHLRVLRGRVFFEALDTDYLTPEYDPEAPDTLLRVTERRKVQGAVLRDMGYAIAPDQSVAMFWFQRIWDAASEAWFVPWLTTAKDQKPRRDVGRTTDHRLGFVPLVWLKNLPGGDGVDGACTFAPAVDTSIEIDYQLSQAGRGLKYQSDPLLMIREPAASDSTQMVRSAGNALIVSEKGDAKLLEIGGTAAAAVVDYVKFLRELAIESIHGNRSSADKVSGAQSGRALEMLHQSLIWLTDQLRVSYGDDGILALMRMVAAASQVYPLTVMGRTVRDLDATGLTLRWGQWFAPTSHDKQSLAAALSTLRAAGLLSRETGVTLADVITNVAAPVDEAAAIMAEETLTRANAEAMPHVQTKLSEAIPA
jgi:hypothetical protein